MRTRDLCDSRTLLYQLIGFTTYNDVAFRMVYDNTVTVVTHPLKVNKRSRHLLDQDIKPIQLLQQHHIGGCDLRDALPYSIHIKQRRQLALNIGGDLPDELLPADAS